jgi:hypothetical protein
MKLVIREGRVKEAAMAEAEVATVLFRNLTVFQKDMR